MSLTTIFLPLSSFTTIKSFTGFVFDSLQTNSIFESLSKDLGNMGSYYIRYMMQMALLLNSIYLLDIPHFLVKTFRKITWQFPDEPFFDNWFYDLGYF